MTEYPYLGFDPAPGSPAIVDDLRQTALRVAARLDAASTSLRRLGDTDSVWQGEAARAFTRRVGDLPKHLSDGASSMNDAARALGSWSSDLADFRRRAADYERQAAQAAASVSASKAAVDALKAPGANATPAQVNAAKDQTTQAQAKARAASDALSDILAQARRLLAEHENTAGQIAHALRAASDVAPAKPGFFSRLGHTLADAADFVVSLPDKAWTWIKDNADLIAQIGDILSDISTVIGLVATVMMFIPPLEAVSGVLFAVAAGFAAGALISHSVAKAAGADVSWGTIGLDAVGVVTWGGGKIATTGMRNAGEMFKTGAALHEASGFETGYEAIGAANFLKYGRIAKGAIVTGTTGLLVGTWNPVFGNVVDDVKKGWNAVTGHQTNESLGGTFLTGVGGGR